MGYDRARRVQNFSPGSEGRTVADGGLPHVMMSPSHVIITHKTVFFWLKMG